MSGFQGRNFTTQQRVDNFERYGFNDRASSVVVMRDRWEVCEDAHFGGRCVVLRPGRYPSLAAMGLNDRVSSVRTVSASARIDDNRVTRRLPLRSTTTTGATTSGCIRPMSRQSAPWWTTRAALLDRARAGRVGSRRRQRPGRDRGRRHRRRSWSPGRRRTRPGHRHRGWRGRGGRGRGEHRPRRPAGAHAGRSALRQRTQPGRPDYWDVTYNFRGQEHRVQMTAAPGPTVTVNRQGEPRA